MLTPIKSKLAQSLSPIFRYPAEKILLIFEVPKELKFGHLSLPVFALAKEQRKAPPLLAKEISEQIAQMNLPEVVKVEPINGYVNFHLNHELLFKSLIHSVNHEAATLGYSSLGKGKTVIIDYSSPNVAKPMHIGHLRATVVGQAIRNLAETQGYKVIGLNHLGDWGSQFGKLAWAYQKWGSEFDFKNNAFEALYSLYVKFHDEVEKHPEFEKEGAATFKRLEEGDPQIVELWKKFIEISMKDFEKQWARLGVKHDLVRGESFYNDRLNATVELIDKKGLLVESEGAMVVDLTAEKMAPCLIRKSDGASLYATRDIASALYRMEELKADLSLYVVGDDQTLHFKQVFKVLEKMGYAWSAQCHHISFGMVRFKDIGKISSRKGNIIRFADVLDKAVELVRGIMKEKNPELFAGDADVVNKISEQVAVGAVTFNDLVNDRVKNVEFDWDRALSFEGDSGPYVQYCHVRCESILKKAGMAIPSEFKLIPTSEEERELVKKLSEYETSLTNAFKHFRPNIVANYLLDVCSAFNRFYQAHRIIGGDPAAMPARLALVHATRAVLREGLKVLNIQAPAQM